MSDFFSMGRLEEAFPAVLSALPTTLVMVFAATVIGTILGLLIALIRIWRVPVLSQIAVVYISFMRGTPMIVQLFLAYYGVPLLVGSITGQNLNSVNALYFAIIAFSINQSAFLAELFRGGLEAVSKGQVEAGESIGLTSWQIYRRVIIPQALRMVLPGYTVQFVWLLQGTSLASTISVVDMMGKAQQLGVSTYHVVEPYIAAAAVFVVLSIGFESLSHVIDRHYAKAW